MATHLDTALVETLIELALDNLAAKKRLAPTLELAEKIATELEALRQQHEPWLQQLIALGWNHWTGANPLRQREVARAVTPATEALTLLRRVPGQLAWAKDEAGRLRPQTREYQVKKIALTVREVGSAAIAVRENVARAQAALENLLPELERDGIAADLVKAIRKVVPNE